MIDTRQFTAGSKVVYWPVKNEATGAFAGEPKYGKITVDPWFHEASKQPVCMIDCVSGFVAVSHLELQNILSAEIHVYTKINSGHYTIESKRTFDTEAEAQEKFEELTLGGYERSNEHTRFRWDLVAIHRTDGALCRRTLYTIEKP